VRVFKFKLTFVVLLIATIVWGIVFYYVLQEYHKFVEGLDPLLRKWGLLDPWWHWNGMPYILFAGFLLLLAWIGFIVTAIDFLWMKKSKINLNLDIFVVLTIVTIICGIVFLSFPWSEDFKIYFYVGGEFLFAVWAIFLWKLFLEKVCPHIERRLKKNV